MKIEIKKNEIIPLIDFELGWRFDEIHNSNIDNNALKNIYALSETEAKFIYKIIKFYESKTGINEEYTETNWFRASCEDETKIENFKKIVSNHLINYNEDVIISWSRRIALKTTKEIFLKYWTDFLYPSSDDAIIISENTNWILKYSHYEVANIWIRK